MKEKKELHFRIKLPYRLRYAVILVLLCVVIAGLGLFVFISDVHTPFDNTLENLALFLSEGMDPPKTGAEMGSLPTLEEISVWLEERRQSEGFFRTAWLPSERVLMHKILLRYDPATLKGKDELDHMILVLQPLLSGKTREVGKLLAYYNVKYIIVSFPKFTLEAYNEYYKGPPRLILQKPYGYAPVGDPVEYIKLLDTQDDLKVVVDNPEYRIYENMDFTIPHISAYNRIFLVAPPDIIRGDIALEVEDAINLLHNPGFEDGFIPWFEEGIEGAKYSIDNMTAYSGQSSLRLELEPEADHSGVHQSIEIEKNSRFRMTARVKSENTQMVQFKAYFRDDAGDRIKPGGADCLQARLGVIPGEDWSWVGWIIEPPPNAVEMEIQLNLIWWMKVDTDKLATIWLDDISVKDWRYYTGQAFSGEEIPPMYQHGQTMATIPGLLSKIPNLDPSQHLLIFGEFLPSEETMEEYLELADTVIFLGDVDGSEEAKKWTEEAQSLLFVYEAESCLTLTPVEVPEETDPIEIADDNQAAFWEGKRARADLIEVPFKMSEETDPIEIADDNQAAFWEGTEARVGSIGIPGLSNEAVEMVKGADSLKITVGSGSSARWSLEHSYTTPQDWSGKDFISLNWYGGNTGATLRLIALDSQEPLNYFLYYFTDDFSGWQKIKMPISDFGTMGEPSWDNITFLQISMMDENVSGTWYLDSIVADVNPPPTATVTVIDSTSTEALFSYDHALVIDGEGQLTKPFFAPRTNYLRFMIRAAVDGEMLLKINDELLDITNVYEGEDGINWYESSPVYLDTGNHILYIDFKGNEATFDQLLILSTEDEDIAFKDIFSTDQLEVDWVEKRPSEYSVRVNSDEPAFIVLGEAYHTEWQASTSDGENLEHIPALPLGWANGFYLPQGGEQQVEILFSLQKIKDIAIRIWMVTWICLIVGIVGSWVLYYRHRFKR